MLFTWPETHQQFCQNKRATARAHAAQAVCLGLAKDCARLGGQEVRGCEVRGMEKVEAARERGGTFLLGTRMLRK